MTAKEKLEIVSELYQLVENGAVVEKEKTSNLEIWHSSRVLSSLILIVGTGIIATFVSAHYEEAARVREETRVTVQRREEAKFQTLTRATVLIGQYMTASRILIELSSSRFDVNSYQHAQNKESVQHFVVERRSTYNDVDWQWRQENLTLELQISNYFSNIPDVARSWQHATAAIGAFNRCATEWAARNVGVTQELPESACLDEEKSARESTIPLRNLLPRRD